MAKYLTEADFVFVPHKLVFHLWTDVSGFD